MSSNDIKTYLVTMLGGSYVDTELTDEDIRVITKQALEKVAPYYSGRRFILGDGKIIDLSQHPITTIIKVYDTSNTQLYSLQDWVFGGAGVMVYSQYMMDRIDVYTCYKMMWNELKNLKGIGFKYMKPYLYLDGYTSQVLIEALVRPQSLADIEPDSFYYTWVKDYILSLAKEIIGRIRSKYSVDGSPYKLDGETLLAEASSKKQELENQLTGDIFVV